jgi:hypothetical protein
MFRPDAVLMHASGENDKGIPNRLRGRIERASFMGSRLRCEIRVGSCLVFGEFPASFEKREGEEVSIEVPAHQIRVFSCPT